jgi:signal peptidase II
MMKKLLFLLFILVNVGCDQISKDIVRRSVEYGKRINLVEKNLILTKVENKGAALGLGQNLPPPAKEVLLNYVPLLFLVGMIVYGFREKRLALSIIIALAFVIGGGLGNLIDRFLFGSVTDFFHVSFGFFKTGIFNMADVSVTFGALLILILSFRNQTQT